MDLSQSDAEIQHGTPRPRRSGPSELTRNRRRSMIKRKPSMNRARLCLVACAISVLAAEPPKSWIDPDTGHRVVRLTEEPGSASLYFNQNGYTADGKKMVYTTPEGISVLDLATGNSHSVVKDRVRIIVTGRKTQNVYYTKGG